MLLYNYKNRTSEPLGYFLIIYFYSAKTIFICILKIYTHEYTWEK